MITEDFELEKEVQDEILELYYKKKEIEKREKEIKENLKLEMEKKRIISLKTDFLSVSYSCPKTRESFNKKLFEEENKELYDTYVSVSFSSPSITIRVKGEK